MSISKKGSTYYRNLRHKKLRRSLKEAGRSKKHSGAGNAEEHVFSFADAYNNERLKEAFGRARTKEQIYEESIDELKDAQDFLLEACKNCEFYPCSIAPGADFSDPTVKEDFRKYRREIFWKYHDSKEVRTRFRNRLDQKDVASGAKSAPCSVLISPSRLKNTDWTFN